MAFVSYRGKKVIPAPFISVQKEYVKSAGGTKIANHPDTASERRDNIVGAQFTIRITGTIVASMMGSPDIDGAFWSAGGYPDESQSNPKSEDGLSSPNLDKQRFNRILKMQQSLRWLFGEDGHYLEIDDGLGNEVFKCVIRTVQGIDFQEAQRGENWTDRSEYTITLIADRIESSGHPLCPLGEDHKDYLNNLPKDENGNDIYLEDASENWSIDPQEEGSDEDSPYTFSVNHQVSATGKRVYDGSGVVTSEAWKEAEKWVKTKMMSGGSGDPQSITSGQQSVMTLGTTGLNLSGYLPYNRLRNENVDEMQGSYSVSETFVLSKENTQENYSVAVRISSQTGLTTLTTDGSVRGYDDNTDELEIYNKVATPNIKYTNALAKFNAINQLSRAQTVATTIGITLNPIALSTNVTHDKTSGNISYNSEYNNRPTTCITGARTETINVTFSGGEDVFATIAVIGRAEGPVMQNMNTIKEKKVVISVDAVMPVPTYVAPVGGGGDVGCDDIKDAICGDKPDTTSLVESLRDEAIGCHPAGNGTDTFKESDSESWNVHNGRYNRNVTYVLKTC